MTRPPKKKRGVRVKVCRELTISGNDCRMRYAKRPGVIYDYDMLHRAGLRLKPGETRTVRLIVEEE